MRLRDLFRLCFLHPVLKYVTALVATLAAVLIRAELQSVLHDQSYYFLILPVMIVWSIYSGFLAGLLVAVVGTSATVYFVIPPSNSFTLQRPELNSLGIHCLMTAGFLWVTDREVKEKRRRVQTERELEQLNHALEAKVAERTMELRAANQELEGFCHSMAHDLRTPGRAIAGNAQILLVDHAHTLSPDLRGHLVRISDAANKLGSLIDALLLYARLAQQELECADLDVGPIVRELAKLEAKRAEVDVVLDLEEGLVLRADERQFRILVVSLLKNSLLYRKPHGPVTIRVRKRGEDIVFADDGIGFDMAYESKVFLAFERLHRDAEYPGVGMGLANVARIIARHRGEVSIESKPGEGTSVYLRIPGLSVKVRELAGAASR